MTPSPHAALLIIGNEILSGRTQDTNTPWIAQNLNELGIVLAEVRVVRDIEADIISAVNIMRGQYQYVFTTGGIGPTHDDITAESVARAFGVPVELSDHAYKMLRAHYASDADMTPARMKMAMVPKGAALIDNPVSGAPGFRMDNVYVFAGVPRIMQAMFDSIRPELKGGSPVLSSTIACDLAESTIADDLAVIQKNFPQTDIGSYPNYRGGILGLSVVARSTDAGALNGATTAIIAMIKKLGGEPKAISTVSDLPKSA